VTGFRIYPFHHKVHISVSRSLSLLSCLAILAVAGVTPARAQTTDNCFDAAEPTPEKYGPTDISAVTGNSGLSVAVNPDATVTVFKWPSPSFYDQIKYRTTDRSKPRFGARPNEGAFLGVAYRTSTNGEWHFSWLRNWGSHQAFEDDDNDAVVTTYKKSAIGLSVTVTDVVASGYDAFFRQVTASRSETSRVRSVRVISFANFNPVFSKTAQSPTDDWCTETDNDDGATFVPTSDAVVYQRSGTDASTGQASSVAIAMGFLGRSNGHKVGPDSYAGNGTEGSAYDDAADGQLSGRKASTGQTDSALADDISLANRRTGSTTAVMTAASTRKAALSLLSAARQTTPAAILKDKNAWWRAWLRSAELPKGAPTAVVRLAKRSLITLRQVSDDDRSMVVASIATQAPYGVDWIREGSYMNRALERAGHPAFVAAHDLRYGDLQSTVDDPPQGGGVVPAGNWAENYYADGVVGGSVPWEIDETGYGIWTLWDHYAQTGDRDHLLLAPIYESIQRAAHYLSDNPPLGCTDPTNNLQCVANEGNQETPSQTLVGAQAAWLGLDSAVSAATVKGGAGAEANAIKWGDRRDALGAAIEANFFDAECQCYTTDYEIGGAFLWPVGYEAYGSPRSDSQADVNYEHMTHVLTGKDTVGRYEAKMLLGNAFAWAGTSDIAKVKRGLEWIATVPTTDGTGLLGEAWMAFPKESSPIATMVSQPHAPSHAMFYLAALKAYGSRPYSFD
jgi:GH15 family glucan-1,4-alpha-glucosidase